MATDSVIELTRRIRQREHRRATAGGNDTVKVGKGREERGGEEGKAGEERAKLMSE